MPANRQTHEVVVFPHKGTDASNADPIQHETGIPRKGISALDRIDMPVTNHDPNPARPVPARIPNEAEFAIPPTFM